MTTRFRNAVAATLLGLAAAITASTASAAIVTGSWDPPLPQTQFPGLGWTTTIIAHVDDVCVRADKSTPLIYNFATTVGCPVSATAFSPLSILKAQVGIYDLESGNIMDVLDFNWQFPIALQLGAGGAISYLQTLSLSPPVRGHFDFSDDYEFALWLPGANPELYYRKFRDGWNWRPFSKVPPAPFTTQFGFYDDSQEEWVLQSQTLRVNGNVFPMPEPGSLALAGLALAAAGLSASRQRRRVA